MSESLKKINEKLRPYHSLLTMVVFFFGLFIWAYNFIISPSDLRVIVQTDQISYPGSIGDYYDVINDFVDIHDTLQMESRTIHGFLLKRL